MTGRAFCRRPKLNVMVETGILARRRHHQGVPLSVLSVQKGKSSTSIRSTDGGAAGGRVAGRRGVRIATGLFPVHSCSKARIRRFWVHYNGGRPAVSVGGIWVALWARGVCQPPPVGTVGRGRRVSGARAALSAADWRRRAPAGDPEPDGLRPAGMLGLGGQSSSVALLGAAFEFDGYVAAELRQAGHGN